MRAKSDFLDAAEPQPHSTTSCSPGRTYTSTSSAIASYTAIVTPLDMPFVH